MLTDAITKIEAAIKRYAPVDTMIAYGSAALGRFRAAEVKTRIAELVRTEAPGQLRYGLLGALVAEGTDEAFPTLITLTTDGDPCTRALAAGALRNFGGRSETLPALKACMEDRFWQVRRAVYGSLPMKPAKAKAESVAILKRALEREKGGDRRWVAHLLHRAGEGAAPPSGPAAIFGLPLTSSRVLIVVQIASDDQLASVKAELGKALDALPDGTQFQIVVDTNKSRAFAKTMQTANKRSRKKVRRWLEKTRPGGESDFAEVLVAAETPYRSRAARRAYPGLPDTIYLIAAAGESKTLAPAIIRFRSWNLGCNATLHVRIATDVPVPKQLAQLVRSTGGVLVAGK